jgi:DNA-binding transcriptional LysR family regulator
VLWEAEEEGFGLALVLEDEAAPHLASGALRQALVDWRQPFAGYYIYYPSRRQQPAAFGLFLEQLHTSPVTQSCGSSDSWHQPQAAERKPPG